MAHVAVMRLAHGESVMLSEEVPLGIIGANETDSRGGLLIFLGHYRQRLAPV